MENLGLRIPPGFLLSFDLFKKSCLLQGRNSELNEEERVLQNRGRPEVAKCGHLRPVNLTFSLSVSSLYFPSAFAERQRR